MEMVGGRQRMQIAQVFQHPNWQLTALARGTSATLSHPSRAHMINRHAPQTRNMINDL